MKKNYADGPHERRVRSFAIGWRASKQCWGVTAGKARHNSSNVRGVTGGKMGHNSYLTLPKCRLLCEVDFESMPSFPIFRCSI